MTNPSASLRAAKIAGGVAVLTVVAVVLFSLSAVGSGLAKVPPPGRPTPAGDVASSPPPEIGAAAPSAPEAGQGAARPQPPPGFAPALLAVCFLMAAAVTPVVLRSRWRGVRAWLALALLVWGQITGLSQLETVVYLPQVSRDFLVSIVLFGTMFSVTFALAAVQILGRVRDPAAVRVEPLRSIGWSWWAGRVAAVAVLHVATYYTAGYYLAWKNPVVRAYYGGTDPGSFLLQLKSIAVGTPWMYPYQLAQGLLWALLVVLLVRMLSGTRLAVALVAAVFLGVLGPCQLLLPNPIMPTDVRLTHLVETIVSRVAFALLAVWVLRPADRSELPQGAA
jgi:hypothetical protein